MKVVCVKNDDDYNFTRKWSTGSIYNIIKYIGHDQSYVTCDHPKESYLKKSIEKMGVEFISLRDHNLNELFSF